MKYFIQETTAFFQISVFIVMLYYLFLSLFGLYKKKDSNIEGYTPKNRFALLIAAHNEEAVIAQIIESLKELDYPQNLYDIFVIADNCNDRTAEIARSYSVNVFERNISSKRGKGYALEWMFSKIFEMPKKYDSLAIFDADNLVSKNFLREMDVKLQSGYKVVQGYIDSKNPHDSWISESYSISFWSTNRLFQLSRSNLGLSNQIGGTGFCVDTEILKKLGWGATCLTEDLEFSCKLVLNGYKVGWAHNAIVYDEKPLTLKQSWNQRKRWMQGFTDVASRFFTTLMKKAITEGNMVAFDCALYTIQPILTLLIGASAILTFFQNNTEGLNIFVINNLPIFTSVTWKIFSIFQFLFTPFIMTLEKKLTKKMFGVFALYSLNVVVFSFIFGASVKGYEILLGNIIYILLFVLALLSQKNKIPLKIFIWYLLYGIYTLTWIPITIQGILSKNNKEWNHTKHTRVISIQELE